REAQRISSTTLWGTPCPTSRRSPPNRMRSHREREGEGAQNRQAMLVKRTAWMRKGSDMQILEVAMVSNDPAEVPISIHDGASRVNVNVPTRRTAARDACPCPQAVEQRGTVAPPPAGGAHGPPSELPRTSRRPPAARSAAALCPSNLSEHLVELD